MRPSILRPSPEEEKGKIIHLAPF
jgi:hypothetical protein